MGARWVNQASLGFSRLSVPIFNATVDGRYPIQAGITGLPAGEADSAFPEVIFAGPNAPTQWRGTDARAFTEYLNNYTLQDNLQWTAGRHGVTFGFQAQRMDANERERTYGSLATFSFSNSQTAGFTRAGTLNAATGNAFASFLLGDLNAANVIEDSQVATSGRFRTYAFWVQDDFKVNARPGPQPRPALRHHAALHRGLRSLVVHGPRPPQRRRRRLSGRDAVRRLRSTNSCQCQTPIKTYYGGVGPRIGAAYSLNDRHGACAAPTASCTRAAAPSAAAPARATVPAHSASQPTRRSRARMASRRPSTGTTACRRIRSRRSSIRRSTPASSPAAAPGGGVTYGDPDIGGRPPRYQNWNIGTQHALTRRSRVGAAYAGSHGDFLGSSGRGIYATSSIPSFLALGNLLTQTANATSIAAARAIVPDVALPYANFSGTIAQMLRPFPQYSGVTDVYGDVARSNVPLAPAHPRAAARATG